MKYILFVVLAMILLSGCVAQEQDVFEKPTGGDAAGTVPAGSLQSQCENMGGTWIEGPQECEGINAQACQELGGNYNECASACRNNPEAQVCTLQCVFVCEFAPSTVIIDETTTTETFLVGPELIDCVGVGPMDCMVVNGKTFYDTIEGFSYQEGTSYELLVEINERNNPPADASAFTYTLVEIVSTSHECTDAEKESLVCTRDYRPVCGDDGQTYSNGCSACSSGQVSVWTSGACN